MTTERRPSGRESRPVLRTFEVTEEATLRMAESAMSNYREASLALMDLVDNAVDNRIPGPPLSVFVRVTKDFITVTNEGGEGLDLEGFQNFLRWGISTKGSRQIGQYGVGGKAAMGFLGNSLDIRASAKDSDIEYHFYDPNWGEKMDQSRKVHTAEERPAEQKEGYFQARVTDLKNRRIDTRTVSARLGDTYRPLLDRGEVKIFVNGKEVIPLEIRYLESDPDFRPERKRLGTGFGDAIDAKVGILEGDQKVKPGIRCYYRGRLIEEGQFFGLPTPAQLPQASRLIGEVHLDHLEVTMNKSDFIKDVKWEDAVYVIRKNLLEPWYGRLTQLKVESTFKLEDYEKSLVREAKRALEHILSVTGLITKRQLPGSSSGRLPPTQIDTPPPLSTGRTRTVGTIGGATPPDIRATRGPNVKRWGALDDWEPVSMGNPNIRSAVVTDDSREVIKINIDFEMYQAAKKAGHDALFLYTGETAILEICKKEHPQLTPVEFMEKVNELYRHLGRFYYENTPYRSRATRGSIYGT